MHGKGDTAKNGYSQEKKRYVDDAEDTARESYRTF